VSPGSGCGSKGPRPTRPPVDGEGVSAPRLPPNAPFRPNQCLYT
jgi:hypothetical protein